MGRVFILFHVFIFGIFFLRLANALASPHLHPSSHLVPNQLWLGGLPNENAAFYNFFNPRGENPDGIKVINLGYNVENPAELAPGETAYVFIGWFMWSLDHCESTVLRKVIDEDSEECQIDLGADPEIVLADLAELPDHCLGPPAEDACQAMRDTLLHMDFGTGMADTRRTLKDDNAYRLELNGTEVPLSHTVIKPFNINIVSQSSCEDEFYYLPIYLYDLYRYVMSPQTGKCVVKASGAEISIEDPGTYELKYFFEFMGEEVFSIPVTVIQH